MSVWNEYDKLKTIFIGKRYDEDITYDVFKDKCSQKDLDAWQQINFETNQDLDIIEDFLRKKVVKVYRPDISRYWHIKDGKGLTEDIHGPGVGGKTPSIKPKGVFEYTSFCPLQTPIGFMEGSYRMISENGKQFDVDIPRFKLIAPQFLN